MIQSRNEADRSALNNHIQPTAIGEKYWIVLGDLHGAIARVANIPELSHAEGIIVTGDLTKLGGVAAARSIIEALQELHPVILAQIGNMDRPEVNEWLEEAGINMHCKVRELAAQVAVLGVGGSTFTPFGTPSEFPEARFAEWLESLANRAVDHKFHIVISHNPPFDTDCDRLADGTHAGSKALREFIEVHQPDACLCGHIHESPAKQLVGRTIVANHGDFASGGYILLHIGQSIRVKLCSLGVQVRQTCPPF